MNTTSARNSDGTKGIILAGGTGSRLYPATLGTCKQLLAVYDKPMIYYPLSVLMLAGIRDVLIVTNACDQAMFERILGHGEKLGICIQYVQQKSPDGIAQALLAASPLMDNEPACVVLGDNLFYGQGFSGMLRQATHDLQAGGTGATVFAYPVKDVRPFGTVTFDEKGHALHIDEKPAQAATGHALTGLYFLDAQAVQMALRLQPSARGELEMTDLLKIYLQQKQLHVQQLGRGFAWLDMGTHDALLDAAHFVQTLEKRQGFKVACPEEIAWRQGWISHTQLQQQAEKLAGKTGNTYGAYLLQLLEHNA